MAEAVVRIKADLECMAAGWTVKALRMASLVIFDCDGVLVDSELLAPFGCVASATELLQCFVGIARKDIYRVILDELEQETPPGLLHQREDLA